MPSKTNGIPISLALSILVIALLLGLQPHYYADIPLQTLIDTGNFTSPASKFLNLEGLSETIHYRDEGVRNSKELPVLLIHGTSSSLHTWEGWVAELGKGHRVISLDLVGFGLTGPAIDGDYTLPAYTKFINDFMVALDIAEYHICGNSLGGNIAWEVSVEYPEKVKSMVLVNAAGYEPNMSKIPMGFILAHLPIIKNLATVITPKFIIDDSLRSVFGNSHSAKITQQLKTRYFDLHLREGNRKALIRRFSVSDKGTRQSLIKKVFCKTLILWGAKDGILPLSDAYRFRDDIGFDGTSARLVVFEELGHVGMEEDPVSTVMEVLGFLKDGGEEGGIVGQNGGTFFRG